MTIGGRSAVLNLVDGNNEVTGLGNILNVFYRSNEVDEWMNSFVTTLDGSAAVTAMNRSS